jgi:asparagine synthase (glutamine-hydrolysing)
MCGITGRMALTRERELIGAMTETMLCQEPDAGGSGLSRTPLGHHRLAVIDLPGGVQPMTVSTPHVDVVVFFFCDAL